jgi:Putative restriction endonuclease
MTVDPKHLAFQQYLDLPEMRARYSIVDGELVMVVAPTTEHQRCILDLVLKLTPVARERLLAEVFIAPIYIVIRRDPLRTCQPELLFISNARRYIIGRQVIEGSPDLAIDILLRRTLVGSWRGSCKIISQLMCVKPGLSRRKGRQSKCCSFPRKASTARACTASATSSSHKSCQSCVSWSTKSSQNWSKVTRRPYRGNYDDYRCLPAQRV